MLLIEMDNNLAVAVSAEYVALGLELGSPLGKIEQFSVADDDDASILAEDRLPSIAQTDNTETPVGKPYAGRNEEAVIVRPPVPQGICHAMQRGPVWPTSAFEIERAGQAAHWRLLRAKTPAS